VSVENPVDHQTVTVTLGQTYTVGTISSTGSTSGRGALLGGLDRSGYRITKGFVNAALSKSLTGPNAACDNRTCVAKNGAKKPLDLQAACEATYTERPIVARPSNPDDAYTSPTMRTPPRRCAHLPDDAHTWNCEET